MIFFYSAQEHVAVRLSNVSLYHDDLNFTIVFLIFYTRDCGKSYYEDKCQNYQYLPHSTNRAPCASRCVVYLATCGMCNKQYVGNTTQTLRKRYASGSRGHKEHLKYHENAGFNEVFKFRVITKTTTEHILDVENQMDS